MELERKEIKALLNKGMFFYAGKRKFTVRQPYLGALDLMTELMLDMDFDDAKLQKDPLRESRKIASKSIKLCAKVVAIAVLNRRWKIKLFAPFLAKYFYWNMKPDELLDLTVIINTMCNYGDFINSIRLMSGVRTTSPSLVEEEKQD